MKRKKADKECEKPENLGRTFRIKTAIPFLTDEKPGLSVTCLSKKFCRCPTNCPTCGEDCCDYFKKELQNPNDSCDIGSWYKGPFRYGTKYPYYIDRNEGMNQLSEVEELNCASYHERTGILGITTCDRERLQGKKYYGPVDPLRPKIDIWCRKKNCKCSEDILAKNGGTSCCSYLKEHLSEKKYDTCDMTWFGDNTNENGGVQHLAKQMKQVTCVDYFVGQKIRDYRDKKKGIHDKKFLNQLKEVCERAEFSSKRFYLPKEGAQTVLTSCVGNKCRCMTNDYAQWKETNAEGTCCDYLKETLE